jgi:hypothetical protein
MELLKLKMSAVSKKKIKICKTIRKLKIKARVKTKLIILTGKNPLVFGGALVFNDDMSCSPY